MASDAPLYDWSREPYVLEIEDLSRILRKSVTTIRRELRKGTMTPRPMPKVGRTAAYQWSRLEVQQFVDGGFRKFEDLVEGRRRRSPFGKGRGHAA